MNNFYDQFAATAARFSANLAVEVQRRDALDQYTYAQLRAMAARAAEFCAQPGRGEDAPRLGRGERAAILADNDERWCATYLGVLRLSGVVVPLDTAYQPKQIAALVCDSGAKLLFTTEKYLAAAQEAVKLSGAPCELVLLRGRTAGLASLDDAFAQPAVDAEPPALPACLATRADPALLLYTSGTTSDPKGVVLTHGNLLAEKEAVFQVLYVGERDCVLGVLPLFHALAQLANLLLPFSVGARVVFLESVNSTELLRALAERGVTTFCCVPQFFYLIHQRVLQEVAQRGAAQRLVFRALLRMNGWLRDFAGLNLGRRLFRRVHDVFGRQMRLLVTGGSRFDPDIGRDLYRLGLELLHAYGLTESAGSATVTRPGGKYATSVGAPLPGVEVKIAPRGNAPGAEATGEDEARDGEVLIRGPIVMPGYFNRPDANAEALQDGWLHTGDLGYLDGAGQLHITGRSKDVIVLSSGKNIYPEEVEAHYLQSPYIQELCVLGVARPDEPAAERLHAVVVPNFEVLRERKILNTREILRFEIEGLSIHLPSHKRILSYEIWSEPLLRTTTRKLKRFEIARRQAQERSRRDAAQDRSVAVARPWSAEDAAWVTRPEVARALEQIREAVQTGARIHPDANIELELGLDSMERVELLTSLQQRFGTRVPDDVAHRIYTVRELVQACVSPDARHAAPTAQGAGTCDAWSALLRAGPEDDPEFAALLRPRPVSSAIFFVVMKLGYLYGRLATRFHVLGRENLPQEGAFLLCPNHQSYLDPFVLVSALPFRVFRNLFFVGASEYFATPLTRWLARKINLVPVDPDTNLLRAMQASAFGLRHGKVLILFPEGERSIDGAPKKFKKGASILSLHLRAPIVPVALDGVFDVWPRGRWPRLSRLLGIAAHVKMRVGAPLDFAAKELFLPPTPTAGNLVLHAEAYYAAAAEQLRAAVLELWDSLRRQPAT